MLMAAVKALKIVKYSVFIELIRLLVALISAILLFGLKFGSDAIAFSYVFGYFVTFCMAIIIYRRVVPLVDETQTEAIPVRKLLKFSLPISLSHGIFYTNERTEVFFLGLFSSSVNVGIYRVAWSLAGLETIIRSSLQEILGPFSAELIFRKEIKQLEVLYKTTAKWAFTGALILFLMYALFGKTILSLLDPTYVTTGLGILIVLGLAQLFNEITGACETILTMSGRSDLALMNTIILFALSITLDLIFIPRYGLMGAGVAGGLTVIAINILQVVELWLLHKIHPFKWSFLKPVIASFVASGIILVLRQFVDTTAFWMDLLYVLIFVTAFVFTLIRQKFDAEDDLVINALKKKLVGLRAVGR